MHKAQALQGAVSLGLKNEIVFGNLYLVQVGDWGISMLRISTRPEYNVRLFKLLGLDLRAAYSEALSPNPHNLEEVHIGIDGLLLAVCCVYEFIERVTHGGNCDGKTERSTADSPTREAVG